MPRCPLREKAASPGCLSLHGLDFPLFSIVNRLRHEEKHSRVTPMASLHHPI